MDEKILTAARCLIGDLTPLPFDCGALCGRACCRPDEDGAGGMYLFPGEGWAGKVLGGDFAPIAVCEGRCDRKGRPLACMIFPLTPVFRVDSPEASEAAFARPRKANECGQSAPGGVWKVRMDARARAMCPLVPSGAKGLERAFARVAVRAIRLIAEDPEGDAFLRKWQAREEEFRNFTL